ncbi:MAG: hypothetical protein A2079_00270 [Geobacteraceae bacterium GWC2_48_7]|nr:MAG: hypothetical protein A2079_00270 [Geobacteraceae bacterium GWC2_48_7]
MPITFSFIIPVKPGGYVKALEALKQLDEDRFPHEVLIAEGRQPSRQRNAAAGKAEGDILYFLDDDSLLDNDTLTNCTAVMLDPTVAVAGGPSLTPADDSGLQQLFGAALSSFFGAGGSCNRYRSYGKLRETTEKELILCNLAIRRDRYLSAGGLDEQLYPNEENELLDRLEKSGERLMHHPAMAVKRSQRSSLKAFVRQMFTYGRGRGEQTLLTKTCSLTSFIPLFFVIYLLLLPLLSVKMLIWKIPLLLYLFLDLLAVLQALVKWKNPGFVLLFFIFPLMHCSNGVGLLYGLIRRKHVHEPDLGINIRSWKTKTFKNLTESSCISNN